MNIENLLKEKKKNKMKNKIVPIINYNFFE